jgi:SAUR family protein
LDNEGECQGLAKLCAGVVRDDKRIPKGYLPIVLVRDDEGGAETRVLVRIKDLQEPCMAALPEMAEEQFGYGQQGGAEGSL